MKNIKKKPRNGNGRSEETKPVTFEEFLKKFMEKLKLVQQIQGEERPCQCSECAGCEEEDDEDEFSTLITEPQNHGKEV